MIALVKIHLKKNLSLVLIKTKKKIRKMCRIKKLVKNLEDKK